MWSHRSCAAFNIWTKALLSFWKEEKYYIIKSSWKQSRSRPGIYGNSISFIVELVFYLWFLCRLLPFKLILELSTVGKKKKNLFHSSMDIDFSLCLLSLSLLAFDSATGFFLHSDFGRKLVQIVSECLKQNWPLYLNSRAKRLFQIYFSIPVWIEQICVPSVPPDRRSPPACLIPVLIYNKHIDLKVPSLFYSNLRWRIKFKLNQYWAWAHSGH